MPKTTLPFDSGAYAPVADRIALFYERHPTGRIITELVERAEVVVFKALVYREDDDTLPAATGWASERVGDGEINAVACLENTETSAIGRALANLGFTASSRRPSAEEMEKAARERARLRREMLNPPRDERIGAAHATDSAPRPAWQPQLAASNDYAEQSARARSRLQIAEAGVAPWRASPSAIDALDLLGEAERAGMDPVRTGKLRMRLQSGTVETPVIERVERALRRWLSDHDSAARRMDTAGD
jgi:hypothetical protein